ncbi:RuBisCO large subunit C-terminal-like domain-containing protein [Streptomyces geranii]|uniref:RuBisCO large subunit C-terminal-like domain-containing protein n=1 Tax=Streptomyces geranii TaxID=2058923 RepID=UPI000D036B37|nr:RuBisCO large subunit C-terminal-like domain-containing protein [Streptomyces geranii]
MLRILTVRSQRDLPPGQQLDPGKFGAVIHIGTAAPWSEVTLALPVSSVEPAEGLSHLLQFLTSVVEYNYADGAWLQRVDLPQRYLRNVPGPQLGTPGLRSLLNIPSRPLLALQVGPRYQSLSALTNLYLEALLAGVDMLVDDILLGDPPGELSLANRVPVLTDLCERASQATGKRKIYSTCLAGSPNQMLGKAHWSADQGVDGFIVNSFTHGLGTLEDLSRAGLNKCIFATNMGSGMVSRPATPTSAVSDRRVGIDEQVISKLSRLAGADAVHTGTTGAECFDVSWGDANRTLAQPIAIVGKTIPPSFCVAEGDLQMINVWPNMRELGRDTIFEVRSAILGAGNSVREKTKRFIDLLERLTVVSDDREALQVYRRIAQTDEDLQRDLDETDLNDW